MENSIKVQVELMDKKRLETHKILLEFAKHIFYKHHEVFQNTEFLHTKKVKILQALNISPDVIR